MPARKILLRALAVVSLVLGVIGVFLPVLPTVPFILLAAWAAARSSPRLHRWLEGHARFGPMIRDWRERGAVGRTAKWAATTMMVASSGVMFATLPNRWLPLAVSALMLAVLAWLWRRPER
jgi:uncharacterized membrane protein YbaN (DUF454 family)